jgi:hypothetical protein
MLIAARCGDPERLRGKPEDVGEAAQVSDIPQWSLSLLEPGDGRWCAPKPLAQLALVPAHLGTRQLQYLRVIAAADSVPQRR